MLFTASFLCDWFYILRLRPCKDVLESVNKYKYKYERQYCRIHFSNKERHGSAREMSGNMQIEISSVMKYMKYPMGRVIETCYEYVNRTYLDSL
jgi:hypothetical protein